MTRRKMENKVLKIILGILIIGSKGIFANQVDELNGKSFYTTEKKEHPKTEEIEKSQVKKESPCLEPYGIKLGKTTIKELKNKFSLKLKEKGPFGQMYYLDPVDFNVGDLKAVGVIVYTLGDGDIIENICILFDGKKYTELKEVLCKSYDITYTKEPFVGDKECDFCQNGNHDQFLFIKEEHMSFDTMLIYRTAKFEEARSEHMKKEMQRKNEDIESKL